MEPSVDLVAKRVKEILEHWHLVRALRGENGRESCEEEGSEPDGCNYCYRPSNDSIKVVEEETQTNEEQK